MNHTHDVYDVIIIGAGPSGLACAIEAKKHQLNYLVIDKGCLVNSIFHFPTNLIFFSTPELLEIGNIPLIIQTEKPTRADMLKYYRRVAQHYELHIHLFEAVYAVEKSGDLFSVNTAKGHYSTKNVVLATGQYDTPNLMNIPGENLSKVHHYYDEAHPYYQKKVAVIGGKNSAVETALELFHNGADVTLIHRHETFGKSVKYWILPDIQNRIKEGKIKAYFNTTVKEIREKSLVLNVADGREIELENDVVFAMTGYLPDRPFLKEIGIQFDETMTPVHHPKTLESNVPCVYIAGVLTAGRDGSKVFIENSRNHGVKIIGNILNGQK